jgi:hypothetical protein
MNSRTGPLKKEHGVEVFHSGKPLPASVTDELLQRIREERDLANLGERARKGESKLSAAWRIAPSKPKRRQSGTPRG